MTTSIPGGVPLTAINQLSIADLKTRINKRRAENNADFLDDTAILYYINDAIDELNAMDEFKNREKYKEYAIDTRSNRFYLFTTIFGVDEPFDKMKKIRYLADTYNRAPFQYSQDYTYEPDPSGNGQGVRFLRDINDTLVFIYHTFIPKVTADSQYIQVTHLANMYFINKVLQYVYESEWREDKVSYYNAKAAEGVSKILGNNGYEQDDHMAMNPSWI